MTTVFISGVHGHKYHTDPDCTQLETHADNVVERELATVSHKGLCKVCSGERREGHLQHHELKNRLLEMDPDEVGV